MTSQSTTAGTNASATPKMQEQTQGAADAKKALLKDIHVKWGKFSEQDVGSLKSNDDLVTQLVAKYGLAKDVAQRDADTLRAGRNI
jgi:hypothetical protein